MPNVQRPTLNVQSWTFSHLHWFRVPMHPQKRMEAFHEPDRLLTRAALLQAIRAATVRERSHRFTGINAASFVCENSLPTRASRGEGEIGDRVEMRPWARSARGSPLLSKTLVESIRRLARRRRQEFPTKAFDKRTKPEPGSAGIPVHR